MVSVLPSVLLLGLAALAAVFLARGRGSPAELVAERGGAARALAVAVAAQGIHFAEEALTGFHRQFPALFGLPSLPFVFFVAFNLTWLAIWMASIAGLRSARAGAFFAAWFLAIAGMLNGIAHPLFALLTREYFPGLLSSPVIGCASAFLWLRLRAATVPREALSL